MLKAIPPKGQKIDSSRMAIAQNIMRNRVDKLGVSEPEVRRQGTNQIVIQLAGVHDPRAAASLIGKTAQLEFYDLEADLTGPSKSVSLQGQPVAEPNVYSLLAGQQALVKDKGAGEWYLLDKTSKKVIAGPATTREALFATKAAKKLKITPRSLQASSSTRSLQAATPAEGQGKAKAKAKPKYVVFGVPKKTAVISCGTDAVACPGVNTTPTSKTWYLFKYDPDNPNGPPEVTGKDLKLSGTRADLDPSRGPVVLMEFNGKGSKKFQKITSGLYRRGNLLGGPQHFAIVLDREIKSFPQIDPNDSSLSNGISGNAQITGLNSFSEAKNLALVLQTGSLPYQFTTLESTNVSATLGKDSLAQAKRAAIGGLIAVAIFLLLLYRFMGVVAVLGLAIYVVLLYGAILLLNVTLTLPGFAGLILTIGVAADANVVVFERIKEEVRSGKSVRAAIGAGYAKGFHTILDANAVTAITAMVLFAVATAGVKGFALMLLIGTVDLAAHGGRRDARDARAARRLQVVRQPVVHGRAREPGHEVPAHRLHGEAEALVRDLGGDRARQHRLARRQGPEPRDRLQGRNADLVPDVEARADQQGARSDERHRPRRRRRPGPRRADRRRVVQELPDPDEDARPARADGLAARPRQCGRREGLRHQERLFELRAADREGRDPRDSLLALPRRPLHRDSLRPEVLRAGDHRDAARRPDHRRRLLDHRPRGDDGDGGGGPDGPRLLDLRHDHHLRPHPGEHPADAARADRRRS